VLWATRLLQPGETQTLRFVAPEAAADHPYVCTFPGHWIRMNGVMHVVLDVEAALAAEAIVPDGPRVGGADAIEPIARSFVRNWTPEDFVAGLGGVDDASPERGREVFEAGSCLKCHVVGGEGGRTGPPLSEVIPRYGREELLTQILDPSRVLLDDYESEVFVIKGGQVHSGRVMAENAREVSVRTNPYLDDVVTTFEKSQIADRWTSQLSAMPEGLLSTFTRAEILDLVAYLESLRETD
jgi:putative heme-binding domain-containing protein